MLCGSSCLRLLTKTDFFDFIGNVMCLIHEVYDKITHIQ
jgi:hypothetical protein